MPTTIVALIIILFALLPGIPAYRVYREFIGSDWRETDFEKVVGIISFSVGGLILYILIAFWLKWTLPAYIIPKTFDYDLFSISILPSIAYPYIGHIFSSLFISIVYIIIIKIVLKKTPFTPYPVAWDDFIRIDVPNHWVVVKLTNGQSYAGYITHNDKSVSQSERDIVLAEPASYDEKQKIYISLNYQRIFLPANMLATIGVVTDLQIDKRISEFGKPLFSEETNNDGK